MMKSLVFTTASMLMMGSTVLAGSLETAVSDATVTPMPIAAPTVTDFSGFYAGLAIGSIGNGTGTYIYDGTPGDSYGLEGEGYGLYAGYNFQRDKLVYGAEVAALSTDGKMPDFGPETYLNSTIDLKGRLGYVLGDALAYGFVGYSTGDWDNYNGLTNPNLTGPNYGVGVDYLINDSWIVGAEYIHRTLEAGFEENDNGIEAEFGMVQLRVGYSF